MIWPGETKKSGAWRVTPRPSLSMILIEIPPKVVGSGSVLAASVRGAMFLITSTIFMWVVGPLTERPFEFPSLPLTWIAILFLGILGSGLAVIMLWYLIHEVGPTRASLVTYLFPVGGVILGVIFLNEQLSWQLLVGSILIVASLAVVNWQPVRRFVPKEA